MQRAEGVSRRSRRLAPLLLALTAAAAGLAGCGGRSAATGAENDGTLACLLADPANAGGCRDVCTRGKPKPNQCSIQGTVDDCVEACAAAVAQTDHACTSCLLAHLDWKSPDFGCGSFECTCTAYGPSFPYAVSDTCKDACGVSVKHQRCLRENTPVPASTGTPPLSRAAILTLALSDLELGPDGTFLGFGNAETRPDYGLPPSPVVGRFAPDGSELWQAPSSLAPSQNRFARVSAGTAALLHYSSSPERPPRALRRRTFPRHHGAVRRVSHREPLRRWPPRTRVQRRRDLLGRSGHHHPARTTERVRRSPSGIRPRRPHDDRDERRRLDGRALHAGRQRARGRVPDARGPRDVGGTRALAERGCRGRRLSAAAKHARSAVLRRDRRAHRAGAGRERQRAVGVSPGCARRVGRRRGAGRGRGRQRLRGEHRGPRERARRRGEVAALQRLRLLRRGAAQASARRHARVEYQHREAFSSVTDLVVDPSGNLVLVVVETRELKSTALLTFAP